MNACGFIGVALALAGCSASFTSPESGDENTELSHEVNAQWLKDREREIADRIVAHVRSLHPVVSPMFPRIRVAKVTFRSSVGREIVNQDVGAVLTTIANSALADLLPESSVAPEWSTTLDVSLRRPAFTTADTVLLTAYMVPGMALCWGTVFVVCPTKNTGVVTIDLVATTPAGGSIAVHGAGAAVLYQQTLIVGDSGDLDFTGHHERNTKALVAAVADVAEKLILKVGEGAP